MICGASRFKLRADCRLRRIPVTSTFVSGAALPSGAAGADCACVSACANASSGAAPSAVVTITRKMVACFIWVSLIGLLSIVVWYARPFVYITATI
jgi:hypothetical protein